MQIYEALCIERFEVERYLKALALFSLEDEEWGRDIHRPLGIYRAGKDDPEDMEPNGYWDMKESLVFDDVGCLTNSQCKSIAFF